MALIGLILSLIAAVISMAAFIIYLRYLADTRTMLLNAPAPAEETYTM